MLTNHDTLTEAFLGIEDKNALAWSVLDTKSEKTVSLAIAVSANRKANKRIAHIEYSPRIDLVFINSDNMLDLYEAKSAYVTDFQPSRIAKNAIYQNDAYLGKCIDNDFAKLKLIREKFSNVRQISCLFYLYEVSKPERQLKYSNPPVPIQNAIQTIQSQVASGILVSHQAINCGEADETEIKIHLCIFDLN